MFTCKEEVRKIQKLHINKNWADIGYNFLVGGDGRIYEGRGWNMEGAHTKHYNKLTIGVAVMGNFEYDVPSFRIINTLKNFAKCAEGMGYLKNDYTLRGHRDFAKTACPGANLYYEIRTWLDYKPHIYT